MADSSKHCGDTPKVTPFCQAVIDFLRSGRALNGMADTWAIAQNVFPEKWDRPQGRGALIGHIDRLTQKHPEIFVRLPARDQWGAATLSLRDEE